MHIGLLAIAIMVLFGGFVLKGIPQYAKLGNLVRVVGLVLLVGAILSMCFVQVNAGFVGVKKLFGRVQGEYLEAGLHMINPFSDVTEIDVKTQNYTMSSTHDEGNKEGDDGIKVLTADGLEVSIDLTVLYKVIPANSPKLLIEVGKDYENKVVRPIARTRIRDNAVFYDAVALYSSKREEFQAKIFKGIENDFKKRGMMLEDLLIRNISLPQAVKSVIEQKISAEQDAQKMQFVLQKEKQEAERKRVEAQGISDYQRIVGAGLTPNQLKYEQIKAMKELANSSNSKVIVLGGNGSTPIILDSKEK